MANLKFKIILIGDQAAGKTSLVTQYIQQSFDAEYKSTIGIDFISKQITRNNHNIRL